MDKITRLLLLYSKLIKGEEVNKMMFCFENECSPRSFDRAIRDIRLYLSDLFCVTELKYKRSDNTYSLEGLKRQMLEPMEYLLVERILKDTAVLRKDEYDILASHLLSNTENALSLETEKKEICRNYESPLHNKALLKMHGDLLSIIRKKKCINMRYFKGDGQIVERAIIPCDIKYDLGYLYLIGFRADSEYNYPAYYRLDRIDSFEIIGEQRRREQEKVKEYKDKYSNGIAQMYGGPYIEAVVRCRNEFFQYVHDKYRNSEIISQDGHYKIIKIGVFEDGFVKWIMSQSPNWIVVERPESTKQKIRQQAEDIYNKYGGASDGKEG